MLLHTLLPVHTMELLYSHTAHCPWVQAMRCYTFKKENTNMNQQTQQSQIPSETMFHLFVSWAGWTSPDEYVLLLTKAIWVGAGNGETLYTAGFTEHMLGLVCVKCVCSKDVRLLLNWQLGISLGFSALRNGGVPYSWNECVFGSPRAFRKLGIPACICINSPALLPCLHIFRQSKASLKQSSSTEAT